MGTQNCKLRLSKTPGKRRSRASRYISPFFSKLSAQRFLALLAFELRAALETDAVAWKLAVQSRRPFVSLRSPKGFVNRGAITDSYSTIADTYGRASGD